MPNTHRAARRHHHHRTFWIPLTLVAAIGALAVTVHARIAAAPINIRGNVIGIVFTPPAGTAAPVTTASYYRTARVCLDANDNAACDATETAAMTDAGGQFFLRGNPSPIVAEIATSSLNNGQPVDKRVVFRAPVEAIAEGTGGSGILAAATVIVSPLSTEIVRMMAADGLGYQDAKQTLAGRLGAPASQLLTDYNKSADGPARRSLLQECVVLTSRFSLAAKMVDRGDVSPAMLKINPAATSPAITMKEAHETSMNLEAIPRYDHIFIIILENKPTASIKNSPFAPRITQWLTQGNQFTSYFANGNPSEPNRIGVSSGDDWGVVDDNGWNCIPSQSPTDPNRIEDGLPAGLNPCTQATNHNLKKPNLFSAMTHAGMSWRLYSESMNPGRDWRLNGANDNTILAPDHVYDSSAPAGVAGLGVAGRMVQFSGSLYQTKHNGSVSFQDVRNEWDFRTSNRTLGGGQWDNALRAKAQAMGLSWDVDQFGADLQSGDVGNLNFLEPDQCDDMHGTTINAAGGGQASDCGGNADIYRGDLYTDGVIRKIMASPLWQNPNKRVAIVISFDEASDSLSTSGFNSCCGWNPLGKPGRTGNGTVQGPLIKTSGGAVAIDSSVTNYPGGNKGHGVSIFGVLTNQPNAPKGIVDSDAYSHLSFVRTLQDMFGLSDPGDDFSYMNRSKYTERFIQQYFALLPEYAGSADAHFDAVRPMNHVYLIPPGYQQKAQAGELGVLNPVQIGPDGTQINVWALKN